MASTRAAWLLAALTSTATAAAQSDRTPGSAFRDCPACPEMVVVPAGSFTMGSSAAARAWAVDHGATPASVADESPPHDVTLASFALGRYNVTRSEYAAFVRATGYAAGNGCHVSDGVHADNSLWKKLPGTNWQNPGFPQTDRDPVVCISWTDAQAYVAWLNTTVHRGYRLPTESEWEYAARGGTTTRFWWGDEDTDAPRYAWHDANAEGHPHPVGSKPANPLGFYDMVGNVWQWTEDCYIDNYTTAPHDGRAVETAKDCLRVDRGGSWFYPSWLLRPATRERNPADNRDVVLGFRVARTLR